MWPWGGFVFFWGGWFWRVLGSDARVAQAFKVSASSVKSHFTPLPRSRDTVVADGHGVLATGEAKPEALHRSRSWGLSGLLGAYGGGPLKASAWELRHSF